MSEWRDAFGVLVENGDVIMSASTSGGMVKIGTADRRPDESQFMMRIELAARWGHKVEKPHKRGAVGYNVLVLRKADGSIPKHLKPLTEERVFPNFDEPVPITAWVEESGMWESDND